MKTSCVLLDLGSTLVNWKNEWIINEVSHKYGISEKVLDREFKKNLPDYAVGKYDELEFWHRIGKSFSSKELSEVSSSLYEEFGRDLMSINNTVYSIVKALKNQQIKLAILSNTEHAIFSIVKDMISLDLFDYQFLSYEIGLQKPDKRIYEYVTKNIPFPKEELLFIDDDLSNIESAKEFGIPSIHFISNEHLLQELQKINLKT